MFFHQFFHQHPSERHDIKKFGFSIAILITVFFTAILPSITHSAQLSQEIASSYSKADYETAAKLLEQELHQLKKKASGDREVAFADVYRKSLFLAHVYAWKLHKPEKALKTYQDLIEFRQSDEQSKELPPYELLLVAELYERKEAFPQAETCYKDFLQEAIAVQEREGDRELIVMNADLMTFAKYQLDSIHLKQDATHNYEPLLKELKLPSLMIHYMAPFLIFVLVPTVEYDATAAMQTDLASYIEQSPTNLSSMLVNYTLILNVAAGSVDESSERAIVTYIDKYSDGFFTLSLRYLLYKFYKESGQGKKAEQLVKEFEDLARKRKMELIIGPDKRFASPDTTWQTFKQALLEGDLNLAIECHIPGDTKYREIYTALGKERMKELAQKMRPIEQITADQQTAKYRIRREEQGKDITYYIYFSNIDGEWKIVQY